MKKFFTLFMLLLLAVTVSAADKYRRTWDFREGWSESTLTALAADGTHWTIVDNGYESKKASYTYAVMDVSGEAVAVPELEGLTLGGIAGGAKHVNIVDKPGTGTIWPDGATCLWINGKNSYDYIEFTVPAGENVKVGYCSHSAKEGRGFKSSGGFAAADGTTTFKEMADGTIKEVELINSNTDEAKCKLTSTSGHHIYYIIIGEGDAPSVTKIGYLYYDAAGDGYAELPLYTALSNVENTEYTAINAATALPTAAELQAYDAVVIDGGVPANDNIVSFFKENMYWQPVVNFNPTLAVALGYGEALTTESETGWALDLKKAWFTGYEGWSENMYNLSNGEVMPVPLKMTDAQSNIAKYVVATDEASAFNDSVIAYVYNNGHNEYVYYGLSGDYGEGTEVILKNIVADAADSKSDISAVSKPAFTASYSEMTTVVGLSNLNKNAKIYYTLDGSDPTTSSTLYTTPLVFTQEATIKAIATADGYTQSTVNSFDVKLYSQAKAPQIAKSGDDATEDATITLSSEDGDNVDIWYNFIGSNDTTKSSKYVAPVVIKHAETITAFAIGKADAEKKLVQSASATADVKANMLKVRRDELAHFNASGWGTLANLSLDGVQMEKWVASNYYFSWGKTAQKSTIESEDPMTDADGNPVYDADNNLVYETTDRAASVTTNSADADWQLTSRGQVVIYQSNTLSKSVGDFSGYNPERAEDYTEQLATNLDVQFGGVYAGDVCNAAVQSTKQYAGPFNVVAIVANVNGNKTTGVGTPGKVAVQISADGNTWETLGDTLVTASIFRNYKKFEVAYDNETPVYVRVASISGSSQAVHDIYVFNHGDKSAAAEAEYTGVKDVTAADNAAPAVVRYFKDGQVVIVKGGKTYTATGVQIK